MALEKYLKGIKRLNMTLEKYQEKQKQKNLEKQTNN
jgi:hypothetical protein